MKLRIRGNSIRLRLTQSEVEKCGRGEQVEETIEFGSFPNEKLIYALVSSEKIKKIGARYDSGKIAVIVSQTEANEWINSEKVGIGGEQILDEGRVLSILVEKDFACLSERANEDESDNFPNPNVGEIC